MIELVGFIKYIIVRGQGGNCSVVGCMNDKLHVMPSDVGVWALMLPVLISRHFIQIFQSRGIIHPSTLQIYQPKRWKIFEVKDKYVPVN